MRIAIRRLWIHLSCNRKQLLLAAFWTFGLLCGSFLADSASPTFLLLTRSATSKAVSVVGLCICSFFTFLLSALAVSFHRIKLLYAIFFCKALLFSWSGCCVMAVFGSAGWLVQFLYQFSDLFFVPALCWFALRHISGGRAGLKKDVSVLLLLAAIVGCIDYFLVSPFLAGLIK